MRLNEKGFSIMETKTLTELLSPSKFSKDGFLGMDTRTPEEIIKADRETLAGLGIDNKKITTSLRSAYVAAERALGNPVELAAGVSAVHHEARGRIPSPFSEDGTFQKGETIVSDKSSGISFCITPLSINLIEKHGFFQGKGSPYRAEPDQAARVLGLG
jgi:hypothetical protein